MHKDVAQLFKGFCDENRLTILELLICGETCACHLIDKIDITQPTMSYHLKLLTDSGLISSYKEGVLKRYHVDFDKIDILITFLTKLKNLNGQCFDD